MLQTGPNGANTQLVVTMVGNPTIVAAGGVAGAQYPMKITDSTGITDLSASLWNLTIGSNSDTVFGPTVGH